MFIDRKLDEAATKSGDIARTGPPRVAPSILAFMHVMRLVAFPLSVGATPVLRLLAGDGEKTCNVSHIARFLFLSSFSGWTPALLYTRSCFRTHRLEKQPASAAAVSMVWVKRD